MESIGEKIRSIRKSKGISQTAVADSCSIKQSSYANIENGKTQNITIEIGKGIAKTLDISFNELFEIEATPQNQAQSESLISEIESLKNQLKDKTLLIETLKNEREHIRWHILSEIVMNYLYHLGISNRIALKIKDEEIKDEEIKDLLVKMRIFITTSLDRNKEFYSKTGLITKEDLDSFIDKFGNAINKEIFTSQQNGNDTNNTFSIAFPFSFDASG